MFEYSSSWSKNWVRMISDALVQVRTQVYLCKRSRHLPSKPQFCKRTGSNLCKSKKKNTWFSLKCHCLGPQNLLNDAYDVCTSADAHSIFISNQNGSYFHKSNTKRSWISLFSPRCSALRFTSADPRSTPTSNPNAAEKMGHFQKNPRQKPLAAPQISFVRVHSEAWFGFPFEASVFSEDLNTDIPPFLHFSCIFSPSLSLFPGAFTSTNPRPLRSASLPFPIGQSEKSRAGERRKKKRERKGGGGEKVENLKDAMTSINPEEHVWAERSD